MNHATRWVCAALPVVLGLVACAGTKTTIPLSWRNPGYDGVVFDDILVVGVGKDDGARRLLEDELAKKLASQGTEAQASWSLLPQITQLTKAELEAAVEGTNANAVIVTRLLGVNQEQEYVRGSSYSVPSNYYGSAYYGYYARSYTVVHEPGYYRTNTIFRLETNLYSASDSGLVWSAQSDTVNPDSIADVIDSMSTAIVKQLRQEKLIP